ncbi:MAG: prolyl oligopeptidase family serine peptidase [Labilithrix sp.]|nr:prolyl oligopeptidase family serine peptidase [Labilithrix sp.]MCW5809684.1 prolyl oligopeptidase family serine peptidase [Labilithrix sp.]
MRKLFVAAGVVLFACSAPAERELAQDVGANEPVGESSAAATDSACPTFRAGAHEGFVVSGQARSFQVLLPPASFAGPRPILFAYHGTSESGARFVSRARLAEFAARGFVVIAPDAKGNGSFWPVWDAMHLPSASAPRNLDVDLFDRLLSCATSKLSIDRTRVFATGHSAGGIFTNHLLRARSSVLAGGIPASGVFDLTGPAGPPPSLDGMLVIVTWGGDNDRYSGSTPSGVHVPEFSFVEQASLASKYYSAQSGVDHVRCRGNDVGHAWIPANDWFIDLMLAHPKGTPAGSLQLPPLPPGARASCSTQPYELAPLPQMTCPSTPRSGCTETCQLVADCAVENRTVGPSLASALRNMGFTTSSCGGCVQRCQAGATSAADQRVLACISDWAQGETCEAGGIEGAFPFFLIVNQCCSNAAGSAMCRQVCSALDSNPAAKAFFPVCQSF